MTNKIEMYKFQKREFNVRNEDDLAEFSYFLHNNKWKNLCPFVVKWPFDNAVDMIKDIIVNEFIDTRGVPSKKYDFTELEKAMR
jgi:hypothetical protein